MAYVSRYEHDVFISYAHVDNEPLGDGDLGWVSLLAQHMQTEIDRKLGRKGSCDLWMDYRLRNNEPFTPSIMNAVGEAATLLVVLSPGYLASPWCERERQAFREIMEGRDPSSIFVVELDPLDDDRPADFSDLNGYRFWVRKPEQRAPRIMGFPKPDENYWDAVLELCHELADKLKKLKTEPKQGTEKSGPVAVKDPDQEAWSPEKTVFLAQTTDDLWQDHKSVRDYLDQVGVGVLPRTAYPQDSDGFRAAAEKDLECCDVFVQLLSGIPGRMPDDVPQGYPKLQFELARAAGKRILQWRSPALDLDTVEIDAVRDLLREPNVRAESISDFMREVKKTVLAQGLAVPPGPGIDKFIFVNSQPDDEVFSTTVKRILDGMGVELAWPPETEDVRKHREFLEQALSTCDGMVLIHGNSPGSWVSSQLMQCRKALAERPENTLRKFAVCRFPPMPKEELNMKLKGLSIFDCDDDGGDDDDRGASAGGTPEEASRHDLHAFLQDLVVTAQA